MRYILATLFIIFHLVSFSQTKDTLKKQSSKKLEVATFIARLDMANATKDGIYLNGYVVNIGYEQAKRLNGKKIRVTGKVTIEKGLKNLPNDPIQQGREKDTKHIGSPKIEIVKN
ncbi:MAG TPA: hypothetical protein VK563_23100 [Puia sp.]|nr:hypothetical protein [Puia sp.]